MATTHRVTKVIGDRTVMAERCDGTDAAQPISHDVECLEKSVEMLRDMLRELNESLDLVLIPEGPKPGCSLAKSASTACPLAERIQGITASVLDIVASVSNTRSRLAL